MRFCLLNLFLILSSLALAQTPHIPLASDTLKKVSKLKSRSQLYINYLSLTEFNPAQNGWFSGLHTQFNWQHTYSRQFELSDEKSIIIRYSFIKHYAGCVRPDNLNRAGAISLRYHQQREGLYLRKTIGASYTRHIYFAPKNYLAAGAEFALFRNQFDFTNSTIPWAINWGNPPFIINSTLPKRVVNNFDATAGLALVSPNVFAEVKVTHLTQPSINFFKIPVSGTTFRRVLFSRIAVPIGLSETCRLAPYLHNTYHTKLDRNTTGAGVILTCNNLSGSAEWANNGSVSGGVMWVNSPKRKYATHRVYVNAMYTRFYKFSELYGTTSRFSLALTVM